MEGSSHRSKEESKLAFIQMWMPILLETVPVTLCCAGCAIEIEGSASQQDSPQDLWRCSGQGKQLPARLLCSSCKALECDPCHTLGCCKV
jgi:hypothetical protein